MQQETIIHGARESTLLCGWCTFVRWIVGSEKQYWCCWCCCCALRLRWRLRYGSETGDGMKKKNCSTHIHTDKKYILYRFTILLSFVVDSWQWYEISVTTTSHKNEGKTNFDTILFFINKSMTCSNMRPTPRAYSIPTEIQTRFSERNVCHSWIRRFFILDTFKPCFKYLTNFLVQLLQIFRVFFFIFL